MTKPAKKSSKPKHTLRSNMAPLVTIFMRPAIMLSRKIAESVARHAHQHYNWIVDLTQTSDKPDMGKLSHPHIKGVISTFNIPGLAEQLTALNKPGVIINANRDIQTDSPNLAFIESDNARIAVLAADHLMQCPCRSFAFFFISKNHQSWVNERAEAFYRHLQQAGQTGKIHICERKLTDYSHTELNFAEIAKWVNSLPRPAGIFAANDERARLLLEACRFKNIKVPEDVAVIGVDNDETFCHLTAPPLSSVIQDAEGMGREAAKLLNQLLNRRRSKPTPRNNRQKRNVINIPPIGIAARESTDPMGIDHPVLRQATTYIRANLRNVQATDVARQANMSRNTLDALICRLTGASIHKVILSQRIRKAGELLQHTNLTLTDIAAQTGFSSTQYMSAVFKHHTGLSPRAYRRA